MKFSLSLKYNAVPEWQDKYLNYSQLKKVIYDLQAKTLNGSTEDDISNVAAKAGPKMFHKKVSNMFKAKNKGSSDNESTYELKDLESGSNSKDTFSSHYADTFDANAVFLERLESELSKIDEFYKATEDELYLEYNQLIENLECGKIHIEMSKNSDAHSILSRKSSVNEAIIKSIKSFSSDIDIERGENQIRDDDEEEDDDFDDHSENSALLNHEDFNIKSQKMITLKKRTTQLFLELSQLKSFIELNRLGFTKITKKFDKSLNTNLKTTLFDTNEFFHNSHTFAYNTLVHLDAKLSNLVEVYASLTDRVDQLEECKDELKSQLREHIIWERNTVWKDMIGLETKTKGDVKVVGGIDALSNDQILELEYFSWPLPRPINLGFTKWVNFKLPKFLRTARAYKLAFIITLTAILLGVPTFNDKAEHRCMALLACVALLWATEAIPLFVTAMLCPLLVVLFKVVKDDDEKVMNAVDASAYVLSKMWSSTIMVLIGGFTLAAALSKYNIAKVLASYILSAAGTKPRNILLSIMAVALFLSMWISNVATPVLCYSLIQGVLRTQTYDSPFAQSLILGVALASNIAGMASPISSPQNIVALTYLSSYGIGWGQWLGVAIPVSIIALVLVWILLILTFNISKAKVIKYKPIKAQFTIKQWFVVFVTILTIILWCVLTKLEDVFGESGQIAVIPIVLFFGTGLLSTADVNNFPWSIVLLAMGSLSLGKAVSSSGLLATIAGALQKKVMDYDLYVIVIIFGILVLVIGTFVSHTVSAIIIIPLVQEIGDLLPGENSAAILIFSTALMASCGMGLASSGFPNVTAISMTDELGNRYLTVNTFITRGVPASFIAYIVVVTIGYGIMKAVV
jgi:phosphate transporter